MSMTDAVSGSFLYPSRLATWSGRGLSSLAVFALLASAAMKLSASPEVIATFAGKFGYPAASLGPIAFLEISCAALYAIPKTRVLGAILVTGYLGGAVATHVRVGDPFLVPVLLGVIAWAGLYLRDRSVQALVPLRTPAPR